MPVLKAILQEAVADQTFTLAAVLVLTIALLRATRSEGRRGVRGMVLLFLCTFLLVVAAGVLRGQDSQAHGEVRLVALVFAAITGIAIGEAVVFDLLAPLIRVKAPRILRDLVGAGAAIVVGLTIASKLGFNLSGIIATSAVVTAVIGFSLQDTLGNVMAGLALQMDNSIRVGDWVKVGDLNGRVTEIRWRYTAVETRNWETLIIPNSVLMKGQVTVLGRRTGKPEQWRRWVWFNVDFRYPPTEVIERVNEALQAAPIERVAADPKPHAILMDLFESYGRYAARYWLTDLAVDDPTDSQVRTRIYFALRRAGIPLSMPAYALFQTRDTPKRRSEKARSEFERRLRALASIDLFHNLSVEDRAFLAEGLRYAPFARGETLTKQGAEGHWLYTIVAGGVSVRVAVEGGLEREVARLHGGSFFGEMSLMTGAPRTATVVALSDVECYRLDKATFQALLEQRPELADEVAGTLARRRVELEAVKENLSDEAKRKRLETAKTDILESIRFFFGLAEEPAAVA